MNTTPTVTALRESHMLTGQTLGLLAFSRNKQIHAHSPRLLVCLYSMEQLKALRINVFSIGLM